jgi:hypothetical protein
MHLLLLCSQPSHQADIFTMLTRCGGDGPEDLQHFVWECPAYDHIRDRYASLFAFNVPDSAQQCMQRIFDTSQQRQLAHCVAAIDVYRRYLLGKGNLFGVRPSLQPVGYVAVMPYPACLRTASPSTTVSVGVLRIAVGALVVATCGFCFACWLKRCCAGCDTCVYNSV